MLLVPVGVVLAGRSLGAMLDRLSTLFTVALPPATSARASDGLKASRGPSLRVRVTDTEGNLIGGVPIQILDSSTPPALLGEGVSGPGGSATFVTVPLPHVRVVASHEPEGVVTSSEIAITEGETTDIELVLTTAEAIRGTAVDEADHPVAAVALSVEGMPWATPPGAATDAEGAFRLVTIPHEATTLVAIARGYQTAKVSLAERARSTYPSELVVRVSLVKGPPIQGDVSDAEGSPLRAQVLACEGEAAEVQVTSAPDGTFELPPSATGCSVVALNDGFAPSEPSVAMAGRRLALRLKTGGGIDGVVVDERGSAVSSFTLGIESFSASRGKSPRSGGRKSFEDAKGGFRWENLAPGTYVLTASSAGKPPTRSDPIAVAGGSFTRGVRIVLARGGLVKGHVYDEKHAPVAGADLSFDQVSSVVASSARTKSDDSGAYILDGAPAGPFSVRADKGGFRQRIVTGQTVASGETLALDIVLSAASSGTTLEFGGIGATLGQTHDGLTFQSVFPGDPADRAGLHAGDIIMRVDGESTDSMSVADVLQRLRGEAGTTVGITVQRAGSNGAPKENITAMVVRTVVVH